MKKFFSLLVLMFLGIFNSTLFAQLDSYKLKPLDLVKVEVFQEPDLEKVVKISANGTVVLPLLGEIEVRDLTIIEAAAKIVKLYEKDYLVDPHVNVFIMEYAPRRISVFGHVNKQGPVLFPPEEDMTLTKAIVNAGGFNTRANRTSVIVKRTMADGTQRTFDINVKEILNNKAARDMPLYDGDIVQVKEDIF